MAGALPVAVSQPSPSLAKFASVLPGVSLDLTSHATGLKEEIVLHSPAAPDTFVFPLTLQGLTAEVVSAGGLAFRDSSGEVRVTSPPGFMTDSSTPEGAEAFSSDVTYELVTIGQVQGLKVTVDREWLNDPARVYPVRIDPTLHVGNASSGSYRNPCGWSEAPSPVRVGNARPCGGGDAYWRSVMYYPYESLYGKQLVGARLRLYVRNEGTQNAYATAITHATQWGWSCVRGGYQQSANGENEQNFYNDLLFNIYNDAINWQEGGRALCLVGYEAPGLYTYKRFDGNELYLDWTEPNRAPNVPDSRSPGHGWVGTSSPTLSARYTDPDPNGGNVDFEIAGGCFCPVATWHGGTASWNPNVGPGTYQWRVRAWDGSLHSAWSPWWTFTVARAPGAPTGVSATPDVGAANVSWTAPADSGGATIDWYAINVYNSDGSYTGIQKIECAGCRSTRITGLSEGRSYYFGVFAHNMAGYGNPGWSNTITTPARPGQPTNVTATAGYASGTVRWTTPVTNGPPITSYAVTAENLTANTSATVTCTDCLNTNTYAFNALVPGQNYRFRVRATNSIGTGSDSANSNTITAEPTVTLAPTNVQASRGDRQATVRWDAPPGSVGGLTEYTVHTYRASDDVRLQTNNAATSTASCGATAAPCHVVTGLRNATAVYFRVTSRNSVVESPESNASNIVTPAGRPFAPINVTASGRDSGAHVDWSPPPPRSDGTPGNNGDEITRYTVTAHRADNNSVHATVDTTSAPVTFNNLVNGERYFFTVSAHNAIGTSDSSTPSNIVTPAGPPSAPTGLAVSPRPGGAYVSWNPSDPNGAGRVDYTIKAFQATDDAFVTSLATGTDTSGTVGGLANGRRYYFTVTAASVGGSSTSGRSAVVVPSDVPGAPTNVRAEVSEWGEAMVSWTQPNSNGALITKYIVRASNGKVIEANWNSQDSEVTAVFTGLSPGVSYTFTVAAVNKNGEGPAVAAVGSVTPIGRPAPPTNARVTESGTDAEVTWTASQVHGTPVSGYTVVAMSATDGSTKTATAGPNATSLSMTGLTAGPYTYSIWADSSYGPSKAVEVAGGLPAPILVALGDSYSSGEGVPGFMPPSDANGCHRSFDAYSQQYIKGTSANPGRLPFSSIFAACSGGLITHVDKTTQNEGDTPDGQLTLLPTNANMVTMTIGGNDARFSDVVQDCILTWFINRQIDGDTNGTGDHFYCEDNWMDPSNPSQYMPRVIAEVKPRLVALYKKIADRAKDAEIFILSYPDLVTSTGRRATCGNDAMEEQDIQWIEGMQADFNAMLREAVNEARGTIGDRLHLVDVQPTMDGHEVCTPDPWIHGLNIDDSTINPPKFSPVFSFHPKKAGHTAEANLLRNAAIVRRPTVTSVAPSSGPSNPSVCTSQVTIRGTNFSSGSMVLFGGVPAQAVQFVSSTELRATPPPRSTATVDVLVRTNQGLNWGQSAPNSAARFEYVRDTIVPQTTSVVSPEPNASDWNNTDPEIALEATDQTCPGDVTSITFAAAGQGGGGQDIPTTTVQGRRVVIQITAEGTTVVSYSAVDSSGNREATKQLTVKLDKTAPSNVRVAPTRAPDRNGWYNRTFTANWSGEDQLSGVATCTTRNYEGPDSASGFLTGTCTDNAGNTSSPVGFAFKFDATAPTAVRGVASRSPDRNGWYNHAVGITFTGSDSTSGIESCTSVTYSGPDSATANVPGSCTDVAGNTASANFGLKYDATPATTTIDGAAAQVAVAGSALTGRANDNLSGVDVTTVTFTPAVGDPIVRQASCVSGCAPGSTSSAWSVSTSGLTGVYTVTARTSDVAGNGGTPSNAVTLTAVG